jgi:NADP-dependent 3-hydroxy acid dehydrogenase YdfG
MSTMEGRSALVTGASAGIGAATARALVRAGARPVLVARREDRLRRLAAELGGAEVLPLDVRDEAALRGALEGRVFDVVLNNAGMARGVEPVQAADPAEFEEVVTTNVLGVLNVLRATLPAMIERGRGDHVFLGSVAGQEVYPGGTVYCATKHAVRAIYRGARLDAAGTGVRFTTVDPGMVRTEFSDVRFRGDRERAKDVYRGMTPLTPEDVAEAILFAVTRPDHVNVGEIVMWATDQASTTVCRRDQ